VRKLSQNYFTDKTAENHTKNRKNETFCQFYENMVVFYTKHSIHYEKNS